MKKRKIVVFGSFVVDLTSRAPHLPVPGETVKGTQFKLGAGGKGSNQGVAAHRAGADVLMMTKIGNDLFGKVALDFYKQEGMDTRYIFVDETLETGTALIMVDESTGQNEILVVSGACGNITDEDIHKALPAILEADLLLLQLEINLEAVEKLINIAHENGIMVILNTAPVQAIPADLLAKADIVTPNEIEAGILTGIEIRTREDVVKAGEAFQKLGVANVVITLGKDGVFVMTKDRQEFIPSITVEAVDTTGAGDAFNGGFVTALAEGFDLFEAARFGNATGALSVTRYGTAPAMPQRQEIDRCYYSLKH